MGSWKPLGHCAYQGMDSYLICLRFKKNEIFKSRRGVEKIFDAEIGKKQRSGKWTRGETEKSVHFDIVMI